MGEIDVGGRSSPRRGRQGCCPARRGGSRRCEGARPGPPSAVPGGWCSIQSRQHHSPARTAGSSRDRCHPGGVRSGGDEVIEGGEVRREWTSPTSSSGPLNPGPNPRANTAYAWWVVDDDGSVEASEDPSRSPRMGRASTTTTEREATATRTLWASMNLAHRSQNLLASLKSRRLPATERARAGREPSRRGTRAWRAGRSRRGEHGERNGERRGDRQAVEEADAERELAEECDAHRQTGKGDGPPEVFTASAAASS